jgi:hypothetical protein
MEVKRYIIHDTQLGLSVTARSLESARLGAAAMNQVAGYQRFVARTVSEVR